VGGAVFIFQLGAPFVRADGSCSRWRAAPYLARDTLFLHSMAWRVSLRGGGVPLSLGPGWGALEEVAAGLPSNV